MNLKEEIKKDKKNLKKGESLVGIYDMKNGAYLYIGDNFVEHCWAVTDAELKKMYEILKRRFK